MTGNIYALDDEREETIIERRDRERSPVENGKVDNSEEVPLIPNLKLDVRRTITCLEVWKEDPPNDGYKGRIPPHSDLNMVSSLYGNGMYEFRALNAEGKILRRTSGVKVAVVAPKDDSPKSALPAPTDDQTRLLTWQAEQHARESARTEAFGRMAVETVRENATAHARMVTEQHTQSTTRDREFFQSLMAQQQQFFAGILQQQEQAHRLSTERSREDFQRSIQIMTLSHERAQRANDPQNMLQTFAQFMQLTGGLGEMEDDAEEPENPAEQPWTRALTEGIGAIKDITELAKFKTALAAQQAKQGGTQPATAPAKRAALPAQTKPTVTPKKRRIPPFTREELQSILLAKQAMAAKGLDFAQTVQQLIPYVLGGSDVDPTESNEPADSDIDESEGEAGGEPGAADVEDA